MPVRGFVMVNGCSLIAIAAFSISLMFMLPVHAVQVPSAANPGVSSQFQVQTHSSLAAAIPGKWVTKTPMPVKRTDTPNGAVGTEIVDAVYEFGGENDNTSYTLNLKYDTSTDKWSVRAPMPRPMEEFALGVWHGRMFAISGHNWTMGGGMDDTTPIPDNYMYDPIGNNWTKKADCPQPRTWPVGAAVKDRIYMIGGWKDHVVNDWNDVYDPVNNTWSTAAPMPTARTFASAAIVNGKIYVIGGYVAGDTTTNVNEMYDPVMNSWSTLAPMPTARCTFAIGVINSKIYCIGGDTGGTYQATGINEVYDPATDTWDADTPMPTPRSSMGACVVGGKLFIIGGWKNSALDVNEMFVPATLSVAIKASPNPIYSENKSVITINVTDGVDPLTGATITLNDSSKGGAFTAVTDHGNGGYTSTYTAPVVSAKTNILITANITKAGHGFKLRSVMLAVNPPPQVSEFALPANIALIAVIIALTGMTAIRRKRIMRQHI